MSSPLPPKARGELAEIRFLLEAAHRGLVVAKPWGDNLPYDFVVGGGRHWFRVQVKSASTRHSRGYHLSCFRPAGHRAYRADELDFLAAYVVPERTWYVLPVRAFAPRKTLVLFPRRPPARGGRFEQYKEAWDLLAR